MFLILSLDGGGVRGRLQVQLLIRLVTENPTLLDRIDLFAGTSVGAVAAACLASVHPDERPSSSPLDAAAEFFDKDAAEVFGVSVEHELRSAKGTLEAEYCSDQLAAILTKRFGSKRLRDLPRRFLACTFQLDPPATRPGQLRRWRTLAQHNMGPPHHIPHNSYDGDGSTAAGAVAGDPTSLLQGSFDDDCGDLTVVDALLRSAAAPTYFPVHQGCVDGGVTANNPTLVAVAAAVSSGVPYEQIVVLSLGTGLAPQFVADAVTCQSPSWGLVDWTPVLLDLLMDGAQELICQTAETLLGSRRFLRVNRVLPGPIKLDDVSALPVLIALANQANLSRAQAFIRSLLEGQSLVRSQFPAPNDSPPPPLTALPSHATKSDATDVPPEQPVSSYCSVQ